MKACKIILLIVLIIKSIVAIIKAYIIDDEEQMERIGTVILGLPTIWFLYWGAGLLDL